MGVGKYLFLWQTDDFSSWIRIDCDFTLCIAEYCFLKISAISSLKSNPASLHPAPLLLHHTSTFYIQSIFTWCHGSHIGFPTCPMKQQPYLCTKPILWELNSFLVQYFLLFQLICTMATDHISKYALILQRTFTCSPWAIFSGCKVFNATGTCKLSISLKLLISNFPIKTKTL